VRVRRPEGAGMGFKIDCVDGITVRDETIEATAVEE
jgi:hypothetical protein